MHASTPDQPVIVRTSRGLTIGGTRITLYQILDYLHADWPIPLIRERLMLSEEKMHAVMAYLDAHRDEVEIEYQRVVQQAEEVRVYWEDRNKERLDAMRAVDSDTLRARLRAHKIPHEQA